MKKRGINIALLVTIFMSLVVGCSTQSATPAPNQQPEGDKPKTGGTITVAAPFEPDTLDPHRTAGTDLVVTLHLGGSLLYKDPDTKEYKPYLASDYKISEDGKTLTFTIRKGITFHDGTPVTAKSFKDTYDRILDPKTNAKQARTMLAPLKSAKAPDDQTLILEIQESNASFLEALSITPTQPLSMKAIEKYGTEYGRNPVGVGPWKFESWNPSEGVTLVRNESFQWAEPIYENQGPPRADKLVIKAIPDTHVRMSALESGSIDIALLVPPKDIKKYRNNPKYQILERLASGTGLMLEMNLTKPMFQDIQVRKAINMLVNKEAIIQAVLSGEGEVSSTPLTSDLLGYDKSLEAYGYQYNVDEAKKLLDAAGWKVNGDGVREKDGKTLTLTLLTTATYGMEGQMIQAMLGEAGIKLNIQNLETAAYVEVASNGDFDVTLGAGGFNDPDVLYVFFHSSQIGAYNFASLKDDKLDALLTKGRATFETNARKQAYVEAQKHLLEQAYVVPIYTSKVFAVVNSRLKGVTWRFIQPTFNDSWVEK